MRDEVFGRIMFVACIIVLGAMLCTKGWTGTLDEAHAWMAELGTKTSPEGWRSIGWMTLTLFSVHYVAGKWRGPQLLALQQTNERKRELDPDMTDPRDDEDEMED